MYVASLSGHCKGPDDATQLTTLFSLAARQSVRELWLLCQQLDSIDYGGLQILLQGMDRLRRVQTSLVFCGLMPAVQAKFEATGLTGIATLVPADAYTGPRPLLR